MIESRACAIWHWWTSNWHEKEKCFGVVGQDIGVGFWELEENFRVENKLSWFGQNRHFFVFDNTRAIVCRVWNGCVFSSMGKKGLHQRAISLIFVLVASSLLNHEMNNFIWLIRNAFYFLWMTRWKKNEGKKEKSDRRLAIEQKVKKMWTLCARFIFHSLIEAALKHKWLWFASIGTISHSVEQIKSNKIYKSL